MASTVINILAVNPPGPEVNFDLWGDATYQPSSSGGSGGWQVVDRPRLPAATQWYDRAPMQLEMSGVLSSRTLNGPENLSIEQWCLLLDQWQDKVPGTDQPAVLEISGPVDGTQHQWALSKLVSNAAIRDAVAGFRVQQQYTLTFIEYNSPLVSISGTPTPAQVANASLTSAESAESYTLYAASAGDTLVTIAVKFLNDYTRWVELAQLNNIRDPSSIVAGQVIKIPQF